MPTGEEPQEEAKESPEEKVEEVVKKPRGKAKASAARAAPGASVVCWAALVCTRPCSQVSKEPGSRSTRLLDLLSTASQPLCEHWRAGTASAVQRCQNENGRAGSRRGPTPSMRGAGSWRRSPLDAARRESSKQWVAAWSRPTPTRPGSNSYATAAKRRLISLLNVPEARLRGVGLHARAQDVVQRGHGRVRVVLAVLERHASIEQPVVPGQVPQKRPQR